MRSEYERRYHEPQTDSKSTLMLGRLIITAALIGVGYVMALLTMALLGS